MSALVIPKVEAVANPCGHCPWRIGNQGQKHAHGFYDIVNVRRLWNGLRTGEAPGMSCHPTDPRMAEFEGYEKTADSPGLRACAGSLVVLAREFSRFQAITIDVTLEEREGAKFKVGEALRRYRAEAGRTGMTRGGLGELAWNMMTGAISLPGDSGRVGDEEIGAPFLPPWEPTILARSQRSTTG